MASASEQRAVMLASVPPSLPLWLQRFFFFCILQGGHGTAGESTKTKQGDNKTKKIKNNSREKCSPVGVAAGHEPVAVGLLRGVHGTVPRDDDPRPEVSLLVGRS